MNMIQQDADKFMSDAMMYKKFMEDHGFDDLINLDSVAGRLAIILNEREAQAESRGYNKAKKDGEEKAIQAAQWAEVRHEQGVKDGIQKCIETLEKLLNLTRLENLRQKFLNK